MLNKDPIHKPESSDEKKAQSVVNNEQNPNPEELPTEKSKNSFALLAQQFKARLNQ